MEVLDTIANNWELYTVDGVTGKALIDYKEVFDGNEFAYAWGYQVVHVYDEETGKFLRYDRNPQLTQAEYVAKEIDEMREFQEEERVGKANALWTALVFFKDLPSVDENIVAIGVEDMNKGGWVTSPRYHIHVVYQNGIPYQELVQVANRLDTLVNDNCYNTDIVNEYDATYQLVAYITDSKKSRNRMEKMKYVFWNT